MKDPILDILDALDKNKIIMLLRQALSLSISNEDGTGDTQWTQVSRALEVAQTEARKIQC